MMQASMVGGGSEKKFSLLNFGLILLVSFSGAFIIDWTISPIYPISGVAYLLLTILFFKDGRIKLLGPTAIPLLLLILWQFISLINDSSINSWIRITMSLFSFFFITAFQDRISIRMIQILIRSFLGINAAFIILETAIRILFPDLDHLKGINPMSAGSLWFYVYKMNSILYLDSNFTAIQVLSGLSLAVFARMFFRGFSSFWMILFYILLILTLSRATILAGTMVLLFLLVPRRYRLFSALMAIIGGIITLLYFQNDPSFHTKFEIFSLTWNYLKDASPFQIIFGAGWSQAVEHLGMGAHTLISTYLIEGGSIFFILMTWFWLANIKASRKWSLLLLIPFWIAGLSFAFTAPFVFVVLALIQVSVYQKEEHSELYTRILN